MEVRFRISAFAHVRIAANRIITASTMSESEITAGTSPCVALAVTFDNSWAETSAIGMDMIFSTVVPMQTDLKLSAI
jgi:hypothetical protein